VTVEDWQQRLAILSNAEMVRAMGMEAENRIREARGEPAPYGEDDFNQIAFEMERLAREITNR
jgi:hypothetical protein